MIYITDTKLDTEAAGEVGHSISEVKVFEAGKKNTALRRLGRNSIIK